MLNNLRWSTGKGFDARWEFHGLPQNFDCFVKFARIWTTEKRNTASLGIMQA